MIWNGHSSYVEKWQMNDIFKRCFFRVITFQSVADPKRLLIYKSQIFSSSPHSGACFLCRVTTELPCFWEVRWSPLAFPVLPLLHYSGLQQRPHSGSQGEMEPSLLLLRSLGVIKEHAPCGEFILMCCTDHSLPLSPAAFGRLACPWA